MADTLAHAEAWIRLAGLAIGAAVVLIVPVTGFMKEYWAYQARLREGERLRRDAARAIPGAALARGLDLADLREAAGELAAAARDVAAALRGLGDGTRPDRNAAGPGDAVPHQ